MPGSHTSRYVFPFCVCFGYKFNFIAVCSQKVAATYRTMSMCKCHASLGSGISEGVHLLSKPDVQFVPFVDKRMELCSIVLTALITGWSIFL